MFGFFEAIYSFLMRQIGNRTDAASSTGSLHAKAADIIVDVATVNTNVGTANTNINAIKTNVGSDASPPSANGDVHSKLKDIKSKLVPSTSGKYSFTSIGSSYYNNTVVNITGAGKLLLLGHAESSDQIFLIQIDNGTVYKLYITAGKSVNFDIPFKTALKVTWSTSGSTAYAGYLLD